MLCMGPGTHQFRQSQRGAVSFLSHLTFIWLVSRNKRAGQPTPVLPEILVLSQAIQGNVPSLFRTVLSPYQEERGVSGAFLQPWHCHRGQPCMCSTRIGSTNWGEALSSMFPWKKHMKGAWFGPEHAESKASERLSSPVALWPA